MSKFSVDAIQTRGQMKGVCSALSPGVDAFCKLPIGHDGAHQYTSGMPPRFSEAAKMAEKSTYPAIRLYCDTSGLREVSIEVDGQFITVITEHGDIVSHIVEPGGILAAIEQERKT